VEVALMEVLGIGSPELALLLIIVVSLVVLFAVVTGVTLWVIFLVKHFYRK
jgi:hypothetical protein